MDGEEYCQNCKAYRRYRSHGWKRSAEGGDECPAWCYCGAKLDEFDAQFCIDCLREEGESIERSLDFERGLGIH